jgi:E3 ubiquitin-protein ligase mind-bomb
MSNVHDLEHIFERRDNADSGGVKVSKRVDSPRLKAQGIFKGAQVVRGKDWLWGDQDGGNGNIGEVVLIRGWEEETFRSVAEVKWAKDNKTNVYRMGHKGKVEDTHSLCLL